MVFEAWEGDDSSSSSGGGSGAGSASSRAQQLKYMRAIMETAISASVGHPYVVCGSH